MIPHSILAVTDFSSSGDWALGRAALLCAQHQATLELIYLAYPGEDPLPDATCRLSHHAHQLRQLYDIRVSAVTHIAFSVEEVATKAASADLIVWGTAPVGGLRSFFMGEPVIEMLRKCQRPVLAVRSPVDGEYKSLMIAVDFSPVSYGLIDLGFALNPSAQVALFHAVSTANEGKLRYAEVSELAIQAYRRECQRYAQNRMLTLTDSYDARRNRLQSLIGRGDPARQLLVQRQHTGADLVIVGKRPASMLTDLIFESVAHRVLRDTRADVLAVPHGFQLVSKATALKRLVN